ncbi:hypothetical protein ABT023_00015 [Micromonospora sp. NPDC002296]|uniref:hypothetical protein n=1 Tax=Micromonospora sp. NPDC002296 TaxID=3154271 RepID=UPI00332C1258
MKRFAPALIVAAALVVAATGVPTTASAATRPASVTTESVGGAAPASYDAGGILVTAPPAPRGMGATANPTISPSVSTLGVAPGDTYICPSGYFCAQVWAGLVWKVFFLYTCQIYDVYNWTGTGYWRNNQSSGAPTPYLLGSQGIPIRVLPKSPSSGSADWDPVYSISPCY